MGIENDFQKKIQCKKKITLKNPTLIKNTTKIQRNVKFFLQKNITFCNLYYYYWNLIIKFCPDSTNWNTPFSETF